MDRTYRLLYLDLGNAVTRVEDIRARDDLAALNQAEQSRGRYGLELWDGLRRVAQIPGDRGMHRAA